MRGVGAAEGAGDVGGAGAVGGTAWHGLSMSRNRNTHYLCGHFADQYTAEPSLVDTPPMRTPYYYGHFFLGFIQFARSFLCV